MPDKPSIWLIAGPNGVGKTTYAMRHIARISGTLEFINQDEIARGLYPLAPTSAKALYAAGKISTARKAVYIRRGISFSVETTLSGRGYLKTVNSAHEHGFRIKMLYFYLPSVEDCMRRIARRVEMGGHDVPPDVVHRRFPRSLGNFREYAGICDHWSVFENSRPQPRMVAECRDGLVTVLEPQLAAAAPAGLADGIMFLKSSCSQGAGSFRE